MKQYLACVTFLCLLFPAFAQDTGKPSAADILDRVRHSVVKLSVVDAKKKKSSGSGVFLTANGQILTCYHVIANAKTVIAHLSDGSTAKVTGVVALSASQDWAVVQSDARNAVPAKRGKASALRQGDRIYTLGAPLGLDLTASDGMVSSIRKIERIGTFLQITAPISKGSSGGPVLNASGEVVGITAFYLTEGNSLNFAVAINNVESAWTGKEKPRPFANATKASGKPSVPDTASNHGSGLESTDVAELYTRGIAETPEDPNGPNAKKAFTRALPYFQKAQRLAPDDPNITSMLALCYIGLDNLEEAIEMAKRSIRLNPANAVPHHLLGIAYAGTDAKDEAIKEYKIAIRLDPDDAISHFNLGNVLDSKGLADKAIKEYRTAIRLEPEIAIIHIVFGVALQRKDQSAEAIKEYKTAIRLEPDNALAHYNLGSIYQSIGSTTEAIAEYKEAIRLEPNDASTHHNLGIAFNAVDREKEALIELRLAARLNPNFADTHIVLGLTHLRLGDRSAAFEEYAILKRLDPELANRLFDLIYPPVK